MMVYKIGKIYFTQSIYNSFCLLNLEDQIATGSYNEFGFWKRQKAKMVYTSVSKPKKIFENYTKVKEFGKIFKVLVKTCIINRLMNFLLIMEQQ